MRLHIIILSLLMVVVCGCSGKKSFKITGTLSDGANTNLYIKYHSDDAVLTGVTAARDGKFEVVGASSQPTIVEILDREYKVLGRVCAQNGDEIEITVDMTDALKCQVKGTPINEQWSKLMSINSIILGKGDSEHINKTVESYIDEHPDDVVATLMFVTFYDASLDPVEADRVFNKIAPEARVPSLVESYMLLSQPFLDPDSYAKVPTFKYRTSESDSAHTFVVTKHPATLLAFTDDQSQRNDSIVPALKKLRRDYSSSRLEIMDFALYPDTVSWKSTIRFDSAQWVQPWTPGGILSPELDILAIPHIPYYIVTDSTGRQLYRGPHYKGATAAIKNLLK